MAKPDPKILEWVEAALAEDQDAFAELVYLFQDPVYNLCYRMLGDAGEAEDATQEAFLRAFLNLRRYDTKRSFKTWLMSIASNHCIDRWRKRRMQLVSLDDEPTAAALALSSSDPLPEQAALSAEQSELLQSLLMKLEESYRLPLVLRYWYDYSYAEIAQLMDTTESAIKSRLFRARRTLADLLSDRDARANDVKDGEDDRFNRLAAPKPKGN
ncbi:MAG: sigma-70 family RNA polymerase sigma factor [Chloroflexota bacterium]|nr:sigma-70 family RNA polymerase sigma factor [Chloroflexota bacterium]